MDEPPSAAPLKRRQLIISTVTPIQQTYYLVTKETLDAYATAGLFSNIFLTIFGVCAGGFTSCWIAETASVVSKEAAKAVSTPKYAFLSFGISYLFLGVYYLAKRRQLRSSILVPHSS